MTVLIAALVFGLLLGGVLTTAAATVWPYQRRFARSADRTAFVLTTGASATIGFLIFGASGLTLLFQALCGARLRSIGFVLGLDVFFYTTGNRHEIESSKCV